MYELNINLTPKEILNKEFKNETNGYRPQEVDSFLDTVISDYTEFIHYIKKMKKENEILLEENNHLKTDLRKLKMELETVQDENASNKFAPNNVDILKRLSNLEKVVYGKNE